MSSGFAACRNLPRSFPRFHSDYGFYCFIHRPVAAILFHSETILGAFKMNREKVAGMRGRQVKLRPVALRFEMTGEALPSIDDVWRIQQASKDAVELFNPRTHHVVKLGLDNIREYLTDLHGGTDGFLQLKVQISLKGIEATVEPLELPRPIIIGAVTVN